MSEQEEYKGDTGFSSYGLDFGSILGLIEDAANFIMNAPYEAGVDFDTEGNPITPGVHYLPDEIQSLYMEKPWIYTALFDDWRNRNFYEKAHMYPNIKDSYGRDLIPRTDAQEGNMYDYDDMLQTQYQPVWGIQHGPNKLGIENYTLSDQHAGYFEDNLYWANMIMPSNTTYSPNEAGEMIPSEAWGTMPSYYHIPWRHDIKKFDPYDIERLGPNFSFTEFPDARGGKVRQPQVRGYDYPTYVTPEGQEIYEWDFMNYYLEDLLK